MSKSNKYALYPVFLQLEGIRCVVIGGGRVAERKVRGLIDTGAALYVISPSLTKPLETWKQANAFVHIEREYQEEDVRQASLVFAATNNREINHQIALACREQIIPVNVADSPELCTFTVPATVRRGELSLAISTSGMNPAIAKAIRLALEEQFGAEWQMLLAIIGQYRQQINERIKDETKRTALYQQMLTPEVIHELVSDPQENVGLKLGKMLERLELE